MPKFDVTDRRCMHFLRSEMKLGLVAKAEQGPGIVSLSFGPVSIPARCRITDIRSEGGMRVSERI